MNRPETFLAFRRRIDDLRDEAIENKDTEMLSSLEWVEEKARKEGKNFYHLVHEILVRNYLG